MLEKAADELHGIHGAFAQPVAADLAVGKGHLAAIDADYPLV